MEIGLLNRFWDPSSQWAVPTNCPFCQSVVPIPRDETLDELYLRCGGYHTCFNHKIKRTYGDPRNIALIGHWDGWQPFSTRSKHGSDTCMYVCIGHHD